MTATQTASADSPVALAAPLEQPPLAAPAEGGVPTPASPSAPQHDERAVRLALGWGSARLSLMLIGHIVEDSREHMPDEVAAEILSIVEREVGR